MEQSWDAKEDTTVSGPSAIGAMMTWLAATNEGAAGGGKIL